MKYMHSQAGNALFLILIAVALFAALSYAVTNSGRGGGGIDREQAALQASELEQSISQIRTAIQRLELINGCSDTQISLHYDSNGNSILDTDGSDTYYNPNSAGNFGCYVFHPDGGGLTFPSITFATGGTPFNGSNRIAGIGRDEADAASAELVIFYQGVPLGVCEAINANRDIPSPPPVSDRWLSPQFAGTYGTSYRIAGPSDAFSGKDVGCMNINDSGTYIIYASVIER